MKIKGFLLIFGPEFGKCTNREGVEMRYAFNHKFFELEEEAQESLQISLQKAKRHNWNWEDYKIVRIDCEGKVL
jgi:hypothetical protein